MAQRAARRRARTGLRAGRAVAPRARRRPPCYQAEHQQQSQRDQHRAHRLLHAEHAGGQRRHRHRERRPCRARHPHRRAPSTSRWPSATGCRCRIADRPSKGGPDRAPGASCCARHQAQRHHVNLAHVRRQAADFDFGDARNHLRRPDGHQQLVRAGAAFVENVGTADVRRQRRGRSQKKSGRICMHASAS